MEFWLDISDVGNKRDYLIAVVEAEGKMKGPHYSAQGLISVKVLEVVVATGIYKRNIYNSVTKGFTTTLIPMGRVGKQYQFIKDEQTLIDRIFSTL